MPVDDHYTLQIVQTGNLDRPVSEEEHDAAVNQFAKAGGYVPETSDLDPQMADHRQPTPHQSAERAELAAVLRTAIGRLRPEYRELVALKYGAGLTNREIARLMGLGESNVGTILHRTVKELRANW